MKKVMGSIRSLLEEEATLSLIVVSIVVLAVQVTSELGLWSMPWFKNNIADLTLALLAMFALGIAAQLRSTNTRLGELSESALEQRDFINKLKQVGITDLWVQGNDRGGVEKWREIRKKAKKLSLISVSAYQYAYGEKNSLKHLLAVEGCNIRILLARPDSDVLSQRERREGKHRIGGITKEIHLTVGIFTDIVEEIKEQMTGSVEIRYFKSGDIPARVEIINDTFIHWTPHILPARSAETPAFEVTVNTDAQTSTLLVKYFETFWQESEQEVVYQWPKQ